MNKLVSDLELANVRQSLQILRNQVAAGQVETEYALRQIDKFTALIERVEGLQKTQSSSLRFEALYNVSRVLGTSLEQETVLAQVMDAIIQLTGAERGFLMLRDDDGNLKTRLARNMDQQTLTPEERQYSRTIANLVIDRNEGLLTTNAVEDPRFAAGASIVSQGLRSIMACPLRARGSVIGIVYVENRIVAGRFSKEDLTTLEALAAQASIAIDNARLFSETDQQLSRRVEELRALRRIDLRLSEMLDPQAAMRYTLEAAMQLAQADAGCLGVAEGDPPAVSAAHQFPDNTDAAALLASDEVAAVVREGKWRLRTDENSAVLIMPVRRETKVIAVMLLKRASAAFESDRIDLVERVAARAAVTFENARLYAAVQAADRAKSEFVGIVAHDLKAPMTSIQGYADLLLLHSTNLDERQRSFLERISGTVRRMETLVSDLADISRIESGHFFMEERAVTVESVVSAVRDQTLPQIQARSHRYHEHIAPGLPPLRTDYFRLVQVLTNLVSNAYKYTPDGGDITLKAALEGGRVWFIVQDTGIGLTEEGVRRLGTRFWRADDSYTRSQPGTGLGFAITASIVEQMGSRIQISSAPGQGSTFRFSVAIME